MDDPDKRAETMEELREAVRARDDFLAIAAHELRNPLTPIKLLIQMLRMANDAGDYARLGTLIGRLDHQVDLFVGRMNVLMDVAQLTSGGLRLEKGNVNLSELVRQVIEAHRPLILRSGSELAIDIEESLVGTFDATALRQIVDNLLSNATKYGLGKPIEVSLKRRGDRAELKVRDHGIGIAAAHRDRIFQRFERAVDRGTQAGFGIGLWVTRRLTEAMGGSITVVGREGSGSCFTVTLPLGF